MKTEVQAITDACFDGGQLMRNLHAVAHPAVSIDGPDFLLWHMLAVTDELLTNDDGGKLVADYFVSYASWFVSKKGRSLESAISNLEYIRDRDTRYERAVAMVIARLGVA